VLRSLLIHRLKFAAVAFLLLGAVATGAMSMAHAPGRQAGKPDLPIALKADDAEGKPRPGRMFVVGRVLDPQGKPVANAVIMVYAALQPPWRRTYAGYTPEPIGTARSDAHGRFQADAPRTTSARHHLVGAVALAPGYGAGWVDLEADSERSKVDITLRSEQAIQGRLFDVNGQPVQGVAVRVATMGRFIPANLAAHRRETIDGPSLDSLNGNRLPAWPEPALSDTDGRFTIRGVGPELRVILAINDPRFARQEYPVDTTRVLVSEPVKLALEPGQIIKGRVTDASTGKPVPHAGLVIFSDKENGSHISEFETDEQGRYRANPRTANRFEVLATAPKDQPNLSLSRKFDWPKGAIEYSVDLALPRGAVIRGRVVEEKSGTPVAGARISFGGRRADNDDTLLTIKVLAETDSNGSFQLTASTGPGFLMVLGPSNDYVLRAEDGDRLIPQGTWQHRPQYAHAFIPCYPKAAGETVEVHVALRRGVSVSGQAIGPDRQPMRDAMMISPLFLEPVDKAALMWLPRNHGSVKNGRFELRGLDPDAETPVYFLDPQHELGATVHLSGKSAEHGSAVVELQHCGIARARLVDRAGKPVTGYRGSSLLAMVVTPGPYPRFRRPDDSRMSANVSTINGIDPVHYTDGPMSDALGHITFPALIPGATYRRTPRNMQEASSNTEFTVRSGETVNLGDIVIEERRR
jgi:protocatechuate 3,4-dioxygenase beta subunit